MTRLPLLCSLLLCGIALPNPHGGVYRGPGSTVPPGGSGGGPATPIGPGAGATTDWNVWWSFNRDPYLQLKQAIRAGLSETGDDEFFLGFGQTRRQAPNDPPAEELRDRVVPALLAGLQGTKNQDLITATLLALAKVGHDPTAGPDLATVLESYLSHSNQEIAETAAVALGLLGREDSALTLAALVGDDKHGRQLVGRKEVPYRTRAFAAYGLGLLGSASEREDVRSFTVFHLAATLESDDTPTRDLGTACVLSYGLVPLEPSGRWPKPEDGPPRPNGNRESQIAWLLQWFSETRASDALRLHAPVALARLSAGTDELAKRAVASVLLTVLANHGKENRDVQRASVIALGRLGDDDNDEIDGRIRDKLRKLFSSKDSMSRDLARVALARVATRPGAGPDAGAALAPVQSWFLKDLVRGKSTSRPWTVFSLGVLAHRRLKSGRSVPEAVTSSLRQALARTRSPRDVGAICTALGLAGDVAAQDLLSDRALGGADDSVRTQAAVALGLIGAKGEAEALSEELLDSIAKPLVVREFASALALLGDHGVLPNLVGALRKARTLPSQSALAFAIGRVGDRRAVDPLLALLEDQEAPEATRAFAAAALGVVGHPDDLPWNSKLAVDLYYGLPPGTLTDGARGILDLL
jgi:HEAT repeat protein